MKQGVRRLIVPTSIVWKGMSKRFSVMYNGKWLKNPEASSSNNTISTSSGTNRPSSSSYTAASFRDKFCCLSREDVIRFLIGCLGALAPLPLSSLASLNIINSNYSSIEASCPAIEVTGKSPEDRIAIAVVEPTSDGQYKIIGEISASKLWKCDYLAAAWSLANLTAGQFVMGVEDNVTSRTLSDSINTLVDPNDIDKEGKLARQKRFSSRNIGFFSKPSSLSFRVCRSMYRGRSAPLTCKVTNSLAAVMAQMLSHRATHVWVTESENEDILVGVVSYAEILAAVTKPPSTTTTTTVNTAVQGLEGFGNE